MEGVTEVVYYLVIPLKHKKKLKVRLKVSEELDSSKVISDIMVRLKDKGLKVYLIHALAKDPPKDSKPPRKNMLWCPYCREWRKFILSQYSPDRKVCEICDISTRDFYIRKFNNLWEGVSLLHIKRGKGK